MQFAVITDINTVESHAWISFTTERLYLTAWNPQLMNGSWGKQVTTVNKIMTGWPRNGVLFIASAEILLISVMPVPKIQVDKHCIVWTSLWLHLNYIVTNRPAVGQFKIPHSQTRKEDTVLTEMRRNVKNASQDGQVLTRAMLSSQNILMHTECTSVSEKPIISWWSQQVPLEQWYTYTRTVTVLKMRY